MRRVPEKLYVHSNTTEVSGMTDTADQQAGPASSYATLFMQGRDKLRLLQFPSEIISGIGLVVKKSWAAGIQDERVVVAGPAAAAAHEFKLAGSPFGTMGGAGDREAVAARVLVRDVLAFLYGRGWLLVTAVSTSGVIGCKDTLVFRQQQRQQQQQIKQRLRQRRQQDRGWWEDEHDSHDTDAEADGDDYEGVGSGRITVAAPVRPPPVDWLVVAVCNSDRLRVIGGGARLVDALRDTIEALDYFQDMEEGVGDVQQCVEFKLRGRPWGCFRSEKKTRAEMLILRVVEVLDRFGWRSYGTVRQRTETDKTKKADTWYFVKAQDWVPGSPFNAQPVEPLALLSVS